MKHLLNRLNRFDTIFHRLIISFTGIVVIVVLSISGFLTVQFSIHYNQKVENLERYRLEHLGNLIKEYLFEEPNRTIMEITSLGNKDKGIQKFLHYPMKNDYYRATELDKYLQVIDAQNVPNIENIELYVLINDIWISTQSGIRYTNKDSEAFLKSLDIFECETKYQDKKRWMSSRIIKMDSVEIPVFSFTAGYPLYTQEQSKFKGYVIINVRQEIIRNLLKDFLIGDLDSIAIMNLNGDIITLEGEKNAFNSLVENNKEFVLKALSNNENQKDSKIDDYIITVQPIGIKDWRIVKLNSAKDYYNETRSIQNKGIYFSIIVMVIGLILSFYFARTLYKPFYLIMDKLKKVKLNKKIKESEYYYIDRAIDELYDLAIIKEEALLKNINIIKNDFIINLLSSKYVNKNDIEDKLQFLGYTENWNYNHLLMIRLHPKIYDRSDELTRNLVTYNMIQFFDGYASGTVRCLSADLFDGKICVIISTQDEGKEQLKILRKKFTDYMKINFSVDPIILQSGKFSDFMDANKAYNTLLKILDYIYFMPHTYFVDWEDIEDKLVNHSKGIDPNFEVFSEALVTRDLERIERVLKCFIEEASMLTAPIEDLNGYILKYVFLYNYFLRDIRKENKSEQEQLFKEINDQYNSEDFYFWFIRLIKNTFTELSKTENNPTLTVVELIEKVIMEHLCEDLSLEYIAEKVYLSPKYISRIFKEEKGINITQFITDCKLKKAVKLLSESNISLEQLIKQVGFSSTNYFIKKFKEKYSITPVQYRRNAIK
ncbi:AraC family transcriptional regulator [Anaerocolumna sp. MB42-C2]|uniref:AraC family transcriptional regulator n=1 Tax=Anaerocolumna sp. MB42-C2 TaxID=3070997 RepID=UPI0027DFDDCC|nr:AraC family transcriptional regulator [Anaerocolumna sp. MB42-C2]WMJ87364.1 AraC family transcriptional regulator [Anaerocolumna sp. MB42-C2]